MIRTLVAAALALTFAQAGGQAYTGRWTAELAGRIYVRLELSLTNGALGGKISLGNIEADAKGEINKVEIAPRESTPLFDVKVRESVLSFSRKDGNDTDHFEMRLGDKGAAELRFLLSETDLKELAAAGISAPKPIGLKKT